MDLNKTIEETKAYIGMWVTADGHIRHQLLPTNRYDEARGSRESAYQGSFKVSGNHIDYKDDTGFVADGEFKDGILYHGGMILYKQKTNLVRMKKTFRLNSIAEFHAFCNLPNPEHPLISVIDYSKVAYPFDETNVKWVQNFYTIGLKRNVHGKFNYGQQQYDFNSGILSFIAPAQFLKLEIDLNMVVEPTGWLLLIHPDFLWSTVLAKKIKSYDFFQYAVNEALFLSDREENIIVEILLNIEKEYQSNMDKFSQELIIAHLDMLLIYSERFYERQFLTRRKSNFELLERFEQVLTNYFKNGTSIAGGIPTVTEIAERLNISPNYLGTLLRLHTQQSTQQHIQNKLIDCAKEQLSSTDLSISEIAYALGFEHPQSFSKLFKSKTSQTPLEFRQLFK